MDIQIHNAVSNKWKTILIKHGIVFLSIKNHKSIEHFESDLKNPGYSSYFEAFPFSNINQIKFNDRSEKITISFTDKENKNKRVGINLGQESLAKDFGLKLGEELKMTKKESTRSSSRIILANVFISTFIVSAGLLTYQIANQKEYLWNIVGIMLAGILFSIVNMIINLRKPTKYTSLSKAKEPLSLEEQPLKLKLPLLEKK